MLDKLNEIEQRYKELEDKLGDKQVLADQKQYSSYAKAYSQLTPIVKKIEEYKKTIAEIEEAQEMLKKEPDTELEKLIKEELESLDTKKKEVEGEIKEILVAKDPNDEKDIIMEIRAGTGGEEAGLFVADLYRIYTRFAESKGWKTDVLDSSPTGVGGFKEIIFEVKGSGAFSKLKYESGVHRVQRVPVTESSGRIHTSAATVAVLPEAEEIEVEVNPQDIKVDIFRSSGPGGQSVNTTDSAVRITHLPTNIVVSCQEERSQLQNRQRAMRILRARLFEKLQEEQQKELAEERKGQVGSGDRSERIRTYNFPQGRVTDHRISLTIYNLDSVLEGNLDEVIEKLEAADRVQKLEQLT